MVRVLFLHPDLGIGGAERLVLDAALALQQKGHKVSFLTNHHDVNHCFEETRSQLPVLTVGDWLPRNIFGRFYAFCAYFRMLYAAFYASFYLSRQEKIDIIFCDLISVGIPILRLAKHSPKIIFYCHFPDQLLSKKDGFLKSVYRAPINYLEEFTTGFADKVLVNSKFTLRIFRETFKRLDIIPDVLYPSMNMESFTKMQKELKEQPLPANIPKDAFIFLSINRYERKKNLVLAINAFKLVCDILPQNEYQRCRLIIAGGYDEHVTENVEHYAELEHVSRNLILEKNVVFLKSLSDAEKITLMNAAHCLLYTPENEHFGIVPLESMYMSKPVIALNSGGPTETIVHNSTGILCENNFSKFAEAMTMLYRDQSLRERMGEMGRKRVQQKFSFQAFGDKLNDIIIELLTTSNSKTK